MTHQNNHKTILSGTNSHFIADLYNRYLSDPHAVDQSWQEFFQSLNDNPAELSADLKGASWSPYKPFVDPEEAAANAAAAAKDKKPDDKRSSDKAFDVKVDEQALKKAQATAVRVSQLIEAYRSYGHLSAKLDPLKLVKPQYPRELDPKTYGFTPNDAEQLVYLDGVWGKEYDSLSNVLSRLHAAYCGTVGIEYKHLPSKEERDWFEQKIESNPFQRTSDATKRKAILQALITADSFERFLQVKFPGQKRFGLEGGDSLIPALEQILAVICHEGAHEVVFGMAHRGRLNVLANILAKPYSKIFWEFKNGPMLPEGIPGSSDVKYHLGASTDRKISGHTVHLTLMPNPSHLEAANPVVTGKVRAKQDCIKNAEAKNIAGILIHGDAAMAGQGIVAETFAMSEIDGYKTHGTIHVVINNQVGFTANPSEGRSSQYCSDMAKIVSNPVLHVNGDDPDAVVWAATLVAEFRQKFARDSVLDIVCYRKHGHNEIDEPAFTQPMMYHVIANIESTQKLYAQKLVTAGIISEAEVNEMLKEFEARLQDAFTEAQTFKPLNADWLEGKWQGISYGEAPNHYETGISQALFDQIAEKLYTLPKEITVHPRIARQIEAKKAIFEAGSGIDWGTGEALAFASLLCEGTPIRLSGQDCNRGTFSHRHAGLYDQETGNRVIPINSVQADQQQIEIYNNLLSEYGVLGFELGYSYERPEALTLWEAQFGDFANGAQIVIDQFISAAETKWLRLSGLVMLLPHGMEGQGPEHSSARLERFLQLCAEDNMVVANCSTPANYFHILRRQMKRAWRKPLVIMSPKYLLRLKEASSHSHEFLGNTHFRPVIGEVDHHISHDAVNRVVLCSGKVYYDLHAERLNRKIEDVVLIRIEQLYPFPHEELKEELAKYPAAEVVWCQEEHQNMGAWHYIDRKIEAVLTELNSAATRPVYKGRPDAASPATGLSSFHAIEQAKLIADALEIETV